MAKRPIKKHGIFFIFLLVLFLAAETSPVLPGDKREKQVILEYSVKRENREKTCFPIKTGIAEYFRSKTGKDLLFLVFYPYRIAPEKWRTIYDYRKKDPANFAVIKLEIHGASPISPGSYPIHPGAVTTVPGGGNFTPTLLTKTSEYRGTTGTGVLTITHMDLKMGGSIEGYLYYWEDDFEISGPFQATFILDH